MSLILRDTGGPSHQCESGWLVITSKKGNTDVTACCEGEHGDDVAAYGAQNVFESALAAWPNIMCTATTTTIKKKNEHEGWQEDQQPWARLTATGSGSNSREVYREPTSEGYWFWVHEFEDQRPWARLTATCCGSNSREVYREPTSEGYWFWVHEFVQLNVVRQKECRKLRPPYLLMHLPMNGQPT